MDKKFVDLLEAFEGCRFEQSLRLSDQIIKKLAKSDSKKKQNLSEQQYDLLYIARTGSLAATGHIDQAHQLIKQKFPNPIINAEHSFFFLQICTLALDQRLPQFTKKIEENKDKKKIDINRFILLTRDFSALARIFLKKFMQQKKHQDSLKQIFLQYLQQLHNQNLINYQRDKIIPQTKQLKLQMISMFLMKFIAGYEARPQKQAKNKTEQIVNKKIDKAVKQIKLRISIHQGKSKQSQENYRNMTDLPLFYPFPYLRSIKNLTNQKADNKIFWVRQFLEIFRKNLDLDKYQPIFAYNCQFIDEYVQEIGQNINKIQKPSQISKQLLYTYNQDPLNQFQNYYNSLYTQLNIFINQQQTLKKKDFYLIALKNTLLQLLKISNTTKNHQFCQQIIIILKKYFGKTLTFPEQMAPYRKNQLIFQQKFIQEFINEPQNNNWKPDDKLIWNINIEIMFVKDLLLNDMEKMLKNWDRYFQLYEKNKQQVQNNRSLQKGQRYLSDQFVILAADSVKLFIEKYQLSDKIREDCYFYIVSHLQKCIKISPYNADLKLRIIYFYDKLNYSQKIVQTLDSMDIKAVQFQTVGYFYLKAIMKSCLFDVQQNLLIKMVKSYQQNFRQSSEYAYKAINQLSFNECEQNLSYHDNIQHSYNFLIILYMLYIKNKGKQPSQFYLQQILRRLQKYKQSLSFNCDFRVMKNKWHLHQQLDIAQFYGILNSSAILQNQCRLKLAYNALHNGKQLSFENIRSKWLPQDVYNFKNYKFFQRKLQYKYTGKLNSEQNTIKELDNYNLITQIRIKVLQFLSKIKKGNIDQCKELTKQINIQIQNYNKYLCELNYRQQTRILPTVRLYVSEAIPHLSNMIDEITANKKKVNKPGERKQLCSAIIDSIIQAITDKIIWQDRVKVQKEYLTQQLFQNEEYLERVSKMSSYQFKKTYKIK